MKRRQRGRREAGRSRRGRSPAGWTGRHWAWLAAALILPFGVGYLFAVRIVFPAPEVAAQGIAVPSLVGLTVDEAQQKLVAEGLGALDATPLPSPIKPEGTILAQSPLPGQQLRSRARVHVAVSSGPPRVFVPDVIGFPVERAAALLTRLGFQVQRTDVRSNTQEGSVIDVEPRPGTHLPLPARIRITVSSGGAEPAAVDTTQRATAHPDGGTAGTSSLNDLS